jgi:hypothetical protein
MFTLYENFGCGQYEVKLKRHLERMFWINTEFFCRKINEFIKRSSCRIRNATSKCLLASFEVIYRI